LFSGLIYWIGFMLRAGEIEWNELHVVDVLPLPIKDRAQLRGQTFASIYSPSNARYDLASDSSYFCATLRSEYKTAWGGGQESGRANVQQRGDGFEGQVFVPVWVSQLFVSDWWQVANQPMQATVTSQGANYQVVVENKLPRKLTQARIVIGGRIHELGELAPRASKTFTLAYNGGTLLRDFVTQHGSTYVSVVQERLRPFGETRGGHLTDLPTDSMVISFNSLLSGTGGGGGGRNPYQNYNEGQFVASPRFDLAPMVERGDAVLLAWDAGNTPAGPMNKFPPRRSNRNTLLRLVVPAATTPN